MDQKQEIQILGTERISKLLLTSITVGILSTLLFQLKPEWVINLFGAGDELYMDFAKKTFRIYLSLVTITGLTKMTTVFFQSIGKSVQAVVASLVRDILCFTPLAIFLSAAMEDRTPGSGINGILLSAPIADGVAAVVILCLTVSFFRKMRKEI